MTVIDIVQANDTVEFLYKNNATDIHEVAYSASLTAARRARSAWARTPGLQRDGLLDCVFPHRPADVLTLQEQRRRTFEDEGVENPEMPPPRDMSDGGQLPRL